MSLNSTKILYKCKASLAITNLVRYNSHYLEMFRCVEKYCKREWDNKQTTERIALKT